MKSISYPACLFVLIGVLNTSLQAQHDKMNFLDPGENFYDTQKRMHQAFKKHEREERRERAERQREGKSGGEGEEQEMAGYELYKRWEDFMEPRVYPSGDKNLAYSAIDNFNAWKQQQAQQRQESTNQVQSSTWQALGPFGDPVNGNAGRVNAVRLDPSSASGLWACTPDGGLWSSSNNGTNWSTNTNNLSPIGCSDVVFDPTNSQIMYLATGDADAGDSKSIGVLKSTDGGATWNATGMVWTTSQGRGIYKLLINPNNKNVIFAATSAGLFRTTNAGATWNTVGSAGSYTDIEYKPGDTTTVYAVSKASTFYKSTNGGATWSSAATGLPAAGNCNRFAIAVTVANPAYVYLVASSWASSGFYGFYRSTNSGGAFTGMLTSSTPNLLGWASNGNDAASGGQGWYTLSIAASPTNADEVCVGGVNIWRTTNGGTNWNLFAHWTGSGAPFVHADIHYLDYKDGSTIYIGCDGGAFYTSNSGVSFSAINGNMNIAEVYKMGNSATTYSLTISGHQDNGTNLYNGTWKRTMGGDGMSAFIDWSNNNVMYGEYYNGSFNRTTNGGTNWSAITSGLSGSAAWNTPWHQDPNTPATLWAGYSQMFKSTNQGTNWSQMGSLSGTSTITEFAIAPSNSNVLYVIQGGTILWKTTNGGTNWSNITGTLPVGSARMTSVAIENDDANSVWITFSGFSNGNKVYKTSDGGTTWTNWSTGLPNIPANWVTYCKNTKDMMYLGCDVGVYYRDSSAASWTLYNNGLPNVSVRDLEIFYPSNKLRAATFGRGIWEVDLISNSAPNASFSVSSAKCSGQAITFTDASTNSPTSWSWTFTGGNPSTSTSQNPVVTYTAAGTYTVSLTATNSSGSSSPSTQTITITATPTITATASSGTICSGSPTTLTGSGATNYTWSPGGSTTSTVSVSPASSTIYTLTGNSNGCANTKTVSVTVNATPTVSVNNATICSGNSTTLTASGATTYSWNTGATTSAITVNPSGTTVYTVTGTSNACNSAKTATVTVNTTPTVSVNNATICSGNSATLTASGATTYSWNTGATTSTITVSPSGTTVYTVTGTSNGCNGAKTATVTVNTTPTVSVNSATICSGNSATLTANGAATYSWNTGASTSTINVNPSSAAIYTVTGTSNGCNDVKTATVTVNATPTVSVNSATICSGGSTTLTAAGANTYSWNTGASTPTINVNPSGTTTYTVTGTSNGCDDVKTATVTVNATPTIGVNNATICSGNSATLTATGATSYSWSTNDATSTISVNPTSTTVYTVTGTSNNCSAVQTSTVTVDQLPAVTASAVQDTICIGNSTSITASGAATYSWSPATGLNTTSGASVSANPTVTTSYTITGTDANSCTNTYQITLRVDGCQAIAVSSGKMQFNVYPNPNDGNFVLELPSGSGNLLNVEVRNALGQLVYMEKIVTNGQALHKNILLPGVSKGLYNLIIWNHNNKTIQKIIVE